MSASFHKGLMGRNHFAYRGEHLWNGLDPEVKQAIALVFHLRYVFLS